MSDEARFSFNLPEHLLFHIIRRLPIKSILVCTSVCKSWNSCIKSPFFISSHLHHSISESRLFLLQLDSHTMCRTTVSFSLRSLDDQDLSECARLYFPKQKVFQYQAFSSCNGLVLFMYGTFQLYPSDLILWNPAIRKSVVIASFRCFRALEVAGLGFSSKTSDYKVLIVMKEKRNQTTLKVEVYSLNTNSWKQLPNVEATPHKGWDDKRQMTFLNGALHFVAFRRPKKPPRFLILAYDLDDEAFREIKLPEPIANDSGESLLWECGGALSVLWFKSVDTSQLQIWVMKEYCVEESWVHLSTIRLENYPIPLCCNGLAYRRNNGRVLLSLGNNGADVFYHDLTSQETEYLGYFDGKLTCTFLDSYVESLILMDRGNDLRSKDVYKTALSSNDAGLIRSSSYANCRDSRPWNPPMNLWDPKYDDYPLDKFDVDDYYYDEYSSDGESQDLDAPNANEELMSDDDVASDDSSLCLDMLGFE